MWGVMPKEMKSCQENEEVEFKKAKGNQKSKTLHISLFNLYNFIFLEIIIILDKISKIYQNIKIYIIFINYIKLN